MEVIFSIFSVLASILTESLYKKSLVNYLFSFDLDKKLILVKKKDINIFKTKKSQQKYFSDELLKINRNNNTEEGQNKIKFIKNKNKGNNIDNDTMKKQETKQKFIKIIKKIELNKNHSDNRIVDKNVKHSKFSKERSNTSRDGSNRKFDFKYNSLVEKNMNYDNKDIKKENDYNKDKNIIKNIELNQFKPKFCYKKQREYIEKILLEEAMKIILVKLDIQNLFKKIRNMNRLKCLMYVKKI